MITLITGTNSGIGLATSVELAKAGHTIIATMRNPAKAEGLLAAATKAGVVVQVAALDVTDPAAIKNVVADVVAEHGAIDLLVNNAGATYVGTLEQISDDDLAHTMNVNFTGVAQLTREVLPHMRAQQAGRVITVTSVGGVVGQPFNDAYCAAKFAVEGLMQSVHPVVSAHGIKISVVEPGAVSSDFVANAGESVGERTNTHDAYTPQIMNYVERTSGAFALAQTPQDIAEVIASIAAEEEPKFRYQTGERSAAFAAMSLGDLDGSIVTGATTAWVN